MASGRKSFVAKRLNTVEAAVRLDQAEVTLRKWRKRGYGPPWYRVGPGRGTIFYLEHEVDAWLVNVTLQARDGASGAFDSVTHEKRRGYRARKCRRQWAFTTTLCWRGSWAIRNPVRRIFCDGLPHSTVSSISFCTARQWPSAGWHKPLHLWSQPCGRVSLAGLPENAMREP